jgi:hypothetical protein
MAFPEWFTGPPVVGGPNQYQVVEATTQAEATKLTAEGYKGPYATQADAETAAGQATAKATSTEIGTPNGINLSVPGLSQVGSFFGALGDANTWIRVAKVVVGGLLLIVGLVHITGADNAVASIARKVPVPI